MRVVISLLDSVGDINLKTNLYGSMVVADLVALVSCKQDILLKSCLCPTSSCQTLRSNMAALTAKNFSKLSNFILQNPERCARQYQTSVMARY